MKLASNNRQGFTLVEVLVATALTVIVLGLIFGPLIEASRFTKNAQLMVRAQDNARFALSEISRDLGDAVFIYDTSSTIACPMTDKSGNMQTVYVPYAKVDLVLPRMEGYCTSPNHPAGISRVFPRNYTYKDPSTGQLVTDPNLVDAAPVCPYDQSPLELRPVQPLAPDTKVVRYFIALHDPTVISSTDGKVHYVNPYAPFNDKPVTTDDGRIVSSNMYVLYRAEFSPTDTSLFPAGNTAAQNLQDPDFFYRTSTNPSGERYCDAWMKISRVVATPDDMDLVTVSYDGNGNPLVTPTVQFTPTVVNDDPLVPANQDGNPENSDYVPTVFKATYGNWTSSYSITVYRPQDNLRYYTQVVSNTTDSTNDLCILKGSGNSGDPNVFDITKYENTSQGPDPNDSSWTGYQYSFGKLGYLDSSGKFNTGTPELAFTVDPNKGVVNFAFPHVDATASANLSGVIGGSAPASFVEPTNNLNGYYSEMSGPNTHRMWEFNVPSSAGTYYDLTDIAGVSNTTETAPQSLLGNSSVVSGMEKVIGPNGNPGQSYGMPTQYTRIPFLDMLSEPGINQYKLDVAYPVTLGGTIQTNMNGTAAIYFHSDNSQAGASALLPQYLSADPTSPDSTLTITDTSGSHQLPGTISNIYVLYYEQNNKSGDVIRASYVTKSVMTITLGMRIYDSSTGKPYSVQLTNKMKLKNTAL